MLESCHALEVVVADKVWEAANHKCSLGGVGWWRRSMRRTRRRGKIEIGTSIFVAGGDLLIDPFMPVYAFLDSHLVCSLCLHGHGTSDIMLGGCITPPLVMVRITSCLVVALTIAPAVQDLAGFAWPCHAHLVGGGQQRIGCKYLASAGRHSDQRLAIRNGPELGAFPKAANSLPGWRAG